MAGVHPIAITGFDYAEEDDGKQRGFIEVVDELIEYKSQISYRFIIIDTITALERYAISYVLKKSGREDGKRYTDISDIEWGKGYNLVAEAIYKQIDRLKKNGFGIFVIGHSKTKKIKNRDGFEYDFTTFNALGKTSDIIEREADFIIHGDMQVEEGVDGQAITNRKLRFRSDGNILCGTRFRNFPSEMEHDVDAFLKAFENAVLGLYDNNEEAVVEAKLEQEKEIEEKLKTTIEEKVKTPDKLIEEITAAVKNIKNIEAMKKEIGIKFQDELGTKNFKKSTDVEGLTNVLEYLKGLV